MEFEKLTKAKMTEEYKKLLAEKEKAVKDSETFCKELKECKVSEAGLKKALDATDKAGKVAVEDFKASNKELEKLKSKIAELEAVSEKPTLEEPPKDLTVETSFEDEETFDEEAFTATSDYKKKKRKKLKKQKPGNYEGLTESEIVQRITGRKLG